MSHPERPSKRLRYTEKLRATNVAKRSLPHMSNSAFVKVIKYVKENEFSQLATHTCTVRLARDASLEDTPYGPMLVTAQLFGTPPHPNREVWIVNPTTYLYSAYNNGGGLCSAISRCPESNPSSHDKPWRLVLYSDEVVPGNNLSPQNNRKVWLIYWSFLEFGYH